MAGNTITCLALFVGLFLILPLFIWDISAAVRYDEYRDYIKSHTNTTCLLLNYTTYARPCRKCSNESMCRENICYDEHFMLSYSILNASNITNTTMISSSRENRTEKYQIKQKYPCYYRTEQVTLVTMDFPDGRTLLHRSRIAHFILVVALQLFVAFIVYYHEEIKRELLEFYKRSKYLTKQACRQMKLI
ncbi:unnamed protein product [Adineta ricciae]|uniref:Uncharacterized protein n=1 Tax=Adineta ricciae TaxID=249248 RepID=A0A815RN05_ADIRI|nr:unnamed protein product [Adineta ricciae]